MREEIQHVSNWKNIQEYPPLGWKSRGNDGARRESKGVIHAKGAPTACENKQSGRGTCLKRKKTRGERKRSNDSGRETGISSARNVRGITSITKNAWRTNGEIQVQKGNGSRLRLVLQGGIAFA